jgi:hypothetical protein
LGRAVRRALAGSLTVLAIAATDCNDPQAPAPPNASTFQGRFEAGELRLDTSAGTQTALRLVVTEVVLDETNHRVHARVGVRNAGTEPVAGPDAITVYDFVPEDVAPANATCIVCVTTPCPPRCDFDHRNTYGDDGILAPGETSSAVEWIFDNPSNESFAFRAEIASPSTPGAGRIAGVVFRDLDHDGQRSNREPGLSDAFVTLVHGDDSRFAHTDAEGRYAFEVTEPGLYELIYGCLPCAAPSILCRLTTPERREVLVVRRADGSLSSFERGDFGCAGIVEDRMRATGVVFEDVNRNGLRDQGEPGLPGVLIRSESVFCDIAPVETHTDARGAYAVVLPGCAPWQVGHGPLRGFEDTTPNPVRVMPRDTPLPGDPPFAARIDFGVARVVAP